MIALEASVYEAENRINFKPILKLIGLLLCAAMVFISVNFFIFVRSIDDLQQRSHASFGDVDGVVVLTGGENRIEAGINLLKNNYGRRLLISGVDENSSRNAIANAVGEANAFKGCCIDLDREAKDTIGNARYTARWVDLHGFKKLIVVTSNYHMPRSLLLLKRQMPGVELVPVSTETSGLEDMNAFQKMASPVVVHEFAKYLTARFGLEPPARMVLSAIGSNSQT